MLRFKRFLLNNGDRVSIALTHERVVGGLIIVLGTKFADKTRISLKVSGPMIDKISLLTLMFYVTLLI